MSVPQIRQIGDMLIVGLPPPPLMAAIETLALHIHPLFDRDPRTRRGGSKECCVLCALTARDFLARMGFDARVAPVAAVLRTEQLTVGVGMPGSAAPSGKWAGHLVALAGGYLIDLALYCARRPNWSFIRGMVALPVAGTVPNKINGLPVLAGFNVDRTFSAAWLANDANTGWQAAPDTECSLREPVVAALYAGMSPIP